MARREVTGYVDTESLRPLLKIRSESEGDVEWDLSYDQDISCSCGCEEIGMYSESVIGSGSECRTRRAMAFNGAIRSWVTWQVTNASVVIVIRPHAVAVD